MNIPTVSILQIDEGRSKTAQVADAGPAEVKADDASANQDFSDLVKTSSDTPPVEVGNIAEGAKGETKPTVELASPDALLGQGPSSGSVLPQTVELADPVKLPQAVSAELNPLPKTVGPSLRDGTPPTGSGSPDTPVVAGTLKPVLPETVRNATTGQGRGGRDLFGTEPKVPAPPAAAEVAVKPGVHGSDAINQSNPKADVVMSENVSRQGDQDVKLKGAIDAPPQRTSDTPPAKTAVERPAMESRTSDAEAKTPRATLTADASEKVRTAQDPIGRETKAPSGPVQPEGRALTRDASLATDRPLEQPRTEAPSPAQGRLAYSTRETTENTRQAPDLGAAKPANASPRAEDISPARDAPPTSGGSPKPPDAAVARPAPGSAKEDARPFEISVRMERQPSGPRPEKSPAPAATLQVAQPTPAVASAPSVDLGRVETGTPQVETGPDLLRVDHSADLDVPRFDVAARDSVSTTLSTVNRAEFARPQMIAVQLADVAKVLRDGQVEVTLYPEELGRVRLTMTPSEAGMTVGLMAERPETLDLMRKYIDLLADELAKQGFENISFDFAGSDTGAQNEESGVFSELADLTAGFETKGVASPSFGASESGVLDLRL